MKKLLYYTDNFKKRNHKRCMQRLFNLITESETQNYPSVNNYCSAALTIDVVTKEREKVSHTRQRYHKRRYHAARILVAETMSN